MDAKITKTRLSRMLSYDWLKMLLTAVAAIVVWMLIFTMTATRITPAQQYTVYNYVGNTSLSAEFYDFLQGGKTADRFSHEVLKIDSYDFTTTGSSTHEILSARMQTDEGDALFLSPLNDASTAYKEDEETKYRYTYLESYLRRYAYMTFDVNEYLEQMRAYLNGYYGDYKAENATLNEEKVETDFRKREKKDKRYKKEGDIRKGIALDKERLEKYRAALINVEGYLENGTITLVETELKETLENGEEKVVVKKGAYAINLCPTTRTSGLQKYVGYSKTVTDEEGNELSVRTAENMMLCLLDLRGMDANYLGENLIFIDYTVQRAMAATVES